MVSITEFTRVIARKAKGLMRKKKNGNQSPSTEPKIAVRWLTEDRAQFLDLQSKSITRASDYLLRRVCQTLSDYNIQ
ncbi:hypothetical protein MCOR25_007063 [Pyricularia grisea]|uniref:Uncharacterized protein n=1 Tax=Pyricularia grisea TaxID=148305 RepID=A0A6P8AZG8_PYRGI|nr:hypothetical protein PgNI_10196 [Pyricularia grisea]KAI6359407.1 hypothetical protein MCOR25_007063 [Pyricularia grisea]TLD07737.1 hypothetical protein PgNI_10196 [Pyricularia grisea]